MWDCYSNVKDNVENYTGTAYSFLGFGLNTTRTEDHLAQVMTLPSASVFLCPHKH